MCVSAESLFFDWMFNFFGGNCIKISVITAVFNRADSIVHAVRSVQNQTHQDIEHVVIDGASTDGTLQILNEVLDSRSILSSEPDNGIYDALNKGLERASGDVIGFMHSDDFFADRFVLESVAAAFEDSDVDGVYGDLKYVSQKNPEKIIRHWVAGGYDRKKLARGWMPPHPTLYLRRSVVDRFGGFDTSFCIAGDYDAMLRYLAIGNIRLAYIRRVLVNMRLGGESNRSVSLILRKSMEDLRALRRNRVGGCSALVWKNLSKVRQFL